MEWYEALGWLSAFLVTISNLICVLEIIKLKKSQKENYVEFHELNMFTRGILDNREFPKYKWEEADVPRGKGRKGKCNVRVEINE